MSIIKIHLYREPNQKQQKYLLTYIQEVHFTIRNFLQFAIKALHIDCQVEDLALQSDGYILPHCLKGNVVKQAEILTIKVKYFKKASPPFQFWTAQKVPQLGQQHKKYSKNIQQQNQMQEQSSNSSNQTPKFSQDGLRKQNLENRLQQSFPHQKNKLKSQQQKKHKKAKQQLKKKKKKAKEQIQSSSSSEQQQIEQKVAKQKKHTQKLQKSKSKVKKIHEQSSEQQQIQQQIQDQPQQQSQQSSQQQQQQPKAQSSSQQSSDEQLPRVSRIKKSQLQQKKLNKKIQKQSKDNTKQISKQTEIRKDERQQKRLKEVRAYRKQKQMQEQIQQPTKNKSNKGLPIKQITISRQQSFGSESKDKKTNGSLKDQNIPIENQVQGKKKATVNYSQRRKIIEADDIQSSDSSSEEPQFNRYKNVPSKIQNKTRQNPVSYGIQSQSQQPTKMIPPALRNKFQYNNKKNEQQDLSHSTQPIKPQAPSSFRKHLQQQWITITKQILQKFSKQKSSQSQTFLHANNLIKFKQIQLDQQKFVPKTSQWIEGTVLSAQKDGKLILGKVSQLGKDYRQRYQIGQFNMVQLQLNKNYLTKEQLPLLGKSEEKTIPQVIEQETKSFQQPSWSKNKVEKSSQKVQDRNSLQKFICGQANFYFSDKNYNFDLFMQMHANKHPQKYIPIRFLLNFPKIKKMLKDEKKLFEYLVQDQKRQIRNYEIDEEHRMIRKKPCIQEKKESVNAVEVEGEKKKNIEQQNGSQNKQSSAKEPSNYLSQQQHQE